MTGVRSESSKTIPLLAITACLLWSSAFVGVKYGLQFAKPFGFAGFRFMLSGCLILPFCFKSIPSHCRQKSFLRLAVIVALFQTFLLYGLFYVGMTRISGALGAIVIGSSPLITALTAHFVLHDDRLTPGKIGTILSGIMGIGNRPGVIDHRQSESLIQAVGQLRVSTAVLCHGCILTADLFKNMDRHG
jgi:drug/metabolite transporter (DMT)-like permease